MEPALDGVPWWTPKWLLTHRPWLACFIAGAIVAGVSTGMVVMARMTEVPVEMTKYKLLLPVGFTREKVGATYVANLCPSRVAGAEEASVAAATRQPDCADEDEASPTISTPPGTAVLTATSAAAEASSKARPTILSTGLAGDLKHDGATFPSTNVELTSENFGRHGLRVNVTVDPSGVAGLRAGVYEGNVVVERTGGDEIVLPIGVTVNEPSRLALPSIWWLLFGGLVGLVIKWFTSSGAPVAKSYRRIKRLRRLLPPDRRERLSEDVETAFRDADEDLGAFDLAAMETHLVRLESSCDALTQVARVLGFAGTVRLRLIGLDGPGLTPGSDAAAARDRVAYALGSLQEKELTRPWPWDDSAAKTARLAKYEQLDASVTRIDAVAGGVASGDAGPTQELQAIADRISKDGAEALMQPPAPRTNAPTAAAAPDAASAAPVATSRHADPAALATLAREQAPTAVSVGRRPDEPVPEEERLARSLSSLAGPVLSVGLLVGLVLVGYTTQVESNASFTGGFHDNLGLWLWSFAGALTGTSLASFVGQLNQSTQTTTAPASVATR